MASVLITGTSRGIGFETALAFSRAGHTVFATMRNPSASPQLGEIAAREKLPLHVSAMDVNSDESVHSGIAAILAAHGSVDVLVNNAGIDRAGAIEELPLSEFRLCMETNYFGAIRCIQALLPSMRKRGSGCIVNVTSVGGLVANPPMTPYCASKWALEALSEALAAEVKPFGIRVAIVEPGIIDTSMARRLADLKADSIYPHSARFAALFTNSLQHPVPPSLVADAIVDIVTRDSGKLRHLVGPDAEAFVNWRRSMSDEDAVALHASDDVAFFASLQSAFAADSES